MIGIKGGAERQSISESTLRRWIREAKLPYYRIAGRIKFDEQNQEKYLQSRRVAAVANQA